MLCHYSTCSPIDFPEPPLPQYSGASIHAFQPWLCSSLYLRNGKDKMKNVTKFFVVFILSYDYCKK